jgi:predicted nucleic acid-binding protein
MDRVFADTGYWIALLNSRDGLHEKAAEVSLSYSSDHIVTSEMVLAEFLNSFSEYGTKLRQAAARATQSLIESHITLVPQTSELFARSLRRYREMADKSWSLTDCSSFLIMEDMKIVDALTHDRHFAQAGFHPLLR